METAINLDTALPALLAFLDAAPLTTAVAELEHAMEGCGQDDLASLLEQRGVTPEVLHAAMLTRARLGRINDVIHAVAIALSLPYLLEPGEQLKRPSLAAGNDPSRPFDVETNKRIAEFKLAKWDGHDAVRKRQTFKDAVALAADDSGRTAELYVLGERPIRFLRDTTSSARWGLDRSPAVHRLFEQKFGTLDTEISEFMRGPGARVRVIDLEQRLPQLFPA